MQTVRKLALASVFALPLSLTAMTASADDIVDTALPEGTVENLLLPENKDMLVSILTYHVVPGEVMAEDAAGATVDIETVQGASVTVDADIAADNGVIHVIDAVIMPPA